MNRYLPVNRRPVVPNSNASLTAAVSSTVGLIIGVVILILAAVILSRMGALGETMEAIKTCTDYLKVKIDEILDSLGEVDFSEILNAITTSETNIIEKVDWVEQKVEEKVSLDLDCLYDNAPDAFQLCCEIVRPADPWVSVGPHSAITMVNDLTTIFDKDTMDIIDQGENGEIFGELPGSSFSDGWMVYDQFSKRFFASALAVCPEGGNISIPGLNDTLYDAGSAFFGPETWSPVTANVVVADPLDACSPLTNGGAMAGNIALIQRGSCPFDTKVRHAEDAGAVAAIIYDNVYGVCPNNMAGDGDPVVSIPSLGITQADGEELLAAIPQTITMTQTPGSVLNSIIPIAISKSNNPQTVSTADWYYHDLSVPYYKGVVADFPKIAVTRDRVYIVTQDFNENEETVFMRILAIDKGGLVNGDPPIILWDQSYQGGDPGTQSWIQPARVKAPLKDFYQRDYFFSYAHRDAYWDTAEQPTTMRILRTDPYNPTGAPLTGVEIPIPPAHPMTWILGDPVLNTVPQPVSPDLGPMPPLENFPLTTAVVLRNNSLWTATSWTGADGQGYIRWYEFDITNDVAFGEITIRQYGDVVHPDGTTSLFYPQIMVDVEQNMALAFAMSGPDMYPSMGYTGRHHTDPLNTIRYPLHVAKQGEQSFDVEYIFGPDRNRWGDYWGLDVDPVDGRTFYMEGMIADPTTLVVDDVSVIWTTALAKFQITKSTDNPAVETTAEETYGTPIPMGKKKKKTDPKRPAPTTKPAHADNDDKGRKRVSIEQFCHAFEPEKMPPKCVPMMAHLEDHPEMAADPGRRPMQ